MDIVVNGETYVEAVVDGKKILVLQEDADKVELSLTRREAQALACILAVIRRDWELNWGSVVSYNDEGISTFSNNAADDIAKVYQDICFAVENDDVFWERYVINVDMEGKK